MGCGRFVVEPTPAFEEAVGGHVHGVVALAALEARVQGQHDGEEVSAHARLVDGARVHDAPGAVRVTPRGSLPLRRVRVRVRVRLRERERERERLRLA